MQLGLSYALTRRQFGKIRHITLYPRTRLIVPTSPPNSHVLVPVCLSLSPKLVNIASLRFNSIECSRPGIEADTDNHLNLLSIDSTPALDVATDLLSHGYLRPHQSTLPQLEVPPPWPLRDVRRQRLLHPLHQTPTHQCPRRPCPKYQDILHL